MGFIFFYYNASLMTTVKYTLETPSVGQQELLRIKLKKGRYNNNKSKTHRGKNPKSNAKQIPKATPFIYEEPDFSRVNIFEISDDNLIDSIQAPEVTDDGGPEEEEAEPETTKKR